MAKRKMLDGIAYVFIGLSAGISVALLLGILFYVLGKGVGTINWQFLTTVPSSLKGTFGIAGNLLNTLYIIIITLLLATPIGVGSAIYLNEYARPGKLVRFIEFTTETLSGIPSIIFGLFGMVFFGVLDSHRCPDFDPDGITAYHKKYPGGIKDGAGELPHRSDGNRSNQVVYDTHGSPSIGNARNHYRRNFIHRTYRGRVSSPFVYRRKWLSSSQERHGVSG